MLLHVQHIGTLVHLIVISLSRESYGWYVLDDAYLQCVLYVHTVHMVFVGTNHPHAYVCVIVI